MLVGPRRAARPACGGCARGTDRRRIGEHGIAIAWTVGDIEDAAGVVEQLSNHVGWVHLQDRRPPPIDSIVEAEPRKTRIVSMGTWGLGPDARERPRYLRFTKRVRGGARVCPACQTTTPFPEYPAIPLRHRHRVTGALRPRQ